MSPLPIPPELKRIIPFIRRAEELDSDKTQPATRLVAYYCRQYAIETGLPLMSTSPAAKATLLAVMSSLEEEKELVGEAFSKVEAYSVTRDFSLKILLSADEQYKAVYRNNQRDYVKAKNLARSYYAAGNFFDVMSIFENGDVEEAGLEQEMNENKRKYCKWRASEILKAVKSGSDLPQPVDEEEEAKEEEEEEEKGEAKSEAKDALDDFGIPEAPVGRRDTGVGGDFKTMDVDDVPSAPVYTPAPTPAPAASSSWFSKKAPGRVSNESVADATELTTFALAALKTKDVDLARQRLKEALQALS